MLISDAFVPNPKHPNGHGSHVSVEIILLSIIEGTGVILNFVVLLVIYFRYKFLRDKTRYMLLGNILFCDLMLLFFIIPTSIKLASCETKSCALILLEKGFCNSMALLFEFCYICAFFTQACLAIDTVIKTRYPCSRYVNKRNYFGVLLFSWALSLTPAIMSLFPDETGVRFAFSKHLQRCAYSNPTQCFYPIYMLVLIHVLLAPVIPGCYFYLAFLVQNLKKRLADPSGPAALQAVNRKRLVCSNMPTCGCSCEGEVQPLRTLSLSSRGGDSALQDIRRLFMVSFATHDRGTASPFYSPRSGLSPHLLSPRERVLPTPAVLTSPEIHFTPVTPMGISPVTSQVRTPKAAVFLMPEKGSGSFMKDPFVLESSILLSESLFQDESGSSTKSKNDDSAGASLAHKAVQTSLSYTPSNDVVDMWNSSESMFDEDLLSGDHHRYKYATPLLLASLGEKKLDHQHAQSDSPQHTSKWSNQVNRLKISSRDSSSSCSSDRAKLQCEDTAEEEKWACKLLQQPPDSLYYLHHGSPQQFKWRRSDASVVLAPRRRSTKNVLHTAVSRFCQHGFLLLAAVYVCSLPYALVSTCPRLSLPPLFSTVSVCLYYSTCVWNPIIYFFMSANFWTQLTMTTNGGRA